MVRINGNEEAAAGMALKDYLEQKQYPADEIVSFVGGG